MFQKKGHHGWPALENNYVFYDEKLVPPAGLTYPLKKNNRGGYVSSNEVINKKGGKWLRYISGYRHNR